MSDLGTKIKYGDLPIGSVFTHEGRSYYMKTEKEGQGALNLIGREVGAFYITFDDDDVYYNPDLSCENLYNKVKEYEEVLKRVMDNLEKETV